jgi:hypothetical protein
LRYGRVAVAALMIVFQCVPLMYAKAESEQVDVVTAGTISSGDRRAAPILEPDMYLPLTTTEYSIVAPGPVLVLSGGEFAISDVETGTVYLLSESRGAIQLTSYGHGPHEMLGVKSLSRCGDGIAVVSTTYESKVVCFGPEGRLVRSTTFPVDAIDMVPSADGALALALDGQNLPVVVSVTDEGDAIRESQVSLVERTHRSDSQGDPSAHTEAFATGVLSANSRAAYGLSPYRTAFFVVGSDGSVERVVQWTDTSFPDGGARQSIVTSGSRIANHGLSVDEDGWVFVLSGVSAQFVSANDGVVIVSSGFHGAQIAVHRYDQLVEQWKAGNDRPN